MKLIEQHFMRLLLLLSVFIGVTMFAFEAQAQANYTFNFFNNGTKTTAPAPMQQPQQVNPAPQLSPQQQPIGPLTAHEARPKEDFYNKWGLQLGYSHSNLDGEKDEQGDNDELTYNGGHVGLHLNVGDSFFLAPKFVFGDLEFAETDVEFGMNGWGVDLGFQNRLTDSFSIKFGIGMTKLSGGAERGYDLESDLTKYEVFLTPTFQLGKNAFLAIDARYTTGQSEVAGSLYNASTMMNEEIAIKQDVNGITLGASLGLYF